MTIRHQILSAPGDAAHCRAERAQAHFSVWTREREREKTRGHQISRSEEARRREPRDNTLTRSPLVTTHKSRSEKKLCFKHDAAAAAATATWASQDKLGIRSVKGPSVATATIPAIAEDDLRRRRKDGKEEQMER
ncbi:hypothetical protein F2P81_005365 [Scophthalmus maximus]|uniref:Uncharacterized protein n=1 Tax=Scophthalmus maximus TaxID=52904 RepID=A0A6A4T726_SCOMX|nr:hypothetical protein F2P81_005365 [Scophthalmus maximus]